MNYRTGITGLSLLVCITTAVAQEAVPDVAAEGNSGFVYNDEWAIVSAPPPPGPYDPVNLDPRIPGQEGNVSPEAGMFPPPFAGTNRTIDDVLATSPPGAGTPPLERQSPAQAARELPYGFQPRGYGGNREYPSSYRPRWPGTANPRKYPSTGWVDRAPGGAYRDEEVPPPPVYDRLMAEPPPGPFGYRSGRY